MVCENCFLWAFSFGLAVMGLVYAMIILMGTKRYPRGNRPPSMYLRVFFWGFLASAAIGLLVGGLIYGVILYS